MNPVKKLLTATRMFRERFGQIDGTRLWLSLLKEKLHRPSHVFSVNVPQLKYPIFLRAHTSDIEVFCQIFVQQELDYDINWAVKYIVDAGANIGLSSIFLANKYPGVTIDAIEVSESNIELLRKNIGFYSNINVVPKGLWWRSANLRISNPSAEPWAYIVEETTEDDAQAIPAIGIGELLGQRNIAQIDILKIDIEGAEAEVFGKSDTPWMSSVRCLMIELHDHFKPGCKDAVLSTLSPFHYSHELRGEYNIFTLATPQNTKETPNMSTESGAGALMAEAISMKVER
jgi:FkbM family methyltransferase